MMDKRIQEFVALRPVLQEQFDGSSKRPFTFTMSEAQIIIEAMAALEKEMLDRPVGDGETFQQRVDAWMQVCFGPEISSDRVERNHRFLEEALELVQSIGCTQSEAHQLVDYVYGRDQGEVN